MTRKDFVAIAETVRKVKDHTVRMFIAHELAVMFCVLNPAFNKKRFFEACDLTEEGR